MGNGRYTRILSTNLGLIASRVLTNVFDYISTPMVFSVRNARGRSYLNTRLPEKGKLPIDCFFERFRTATAIISRSYSREEWPHHVKKIGIQKFSSIKHAIAKS